jgi:hypothetical protein
MFHGATLRHRTRAAVLALLACISTRSARADGYAPTVDARSSPELAAAPVAGPPYLPRLPYVPGQVPPPGYHVESHVRPWIPIVGVSGVLAFYALGVAFVASQNCSFANWAFLPVAGPFIASEQYRHPPRSGQCADSDGVGRAVMLDVGVGQSVGALFLVATPLFPKKELVRGEIDGTPPATSDLTLHVAPNLGPNGAGVRVLGTF